MAFNLKTCLDTLGLLGQAEREAGGLYRACALRWPQHEEFWGKLARREDQHEQYILMLATLVEATPDEFTAGRQFSAAAIGTFINGVRSNAAKVAKGELNSRQAFFIALDIEKSIIKRNFFKVVETGNKELRGFLCKVAGEADEHARVINEELRKYSERQP
ncbi:MAG: hypothetical protein PHW69_04425 [Elusimicrobiaceae bacterium]|nr:hypothetical protein [Elusimicrobiaceae bacterium]